MSVSRLAELEEVRARAQREHESFSREVAAEAREAADKARAEVAARHAAKLAELREAKAAAQRAWQAELDASASHEWEGKKVTRQKNVGLSYSPKYETIFGIVEVRRSNTAFPGNVGYGLPKMGEPFVRLLKKDGTPGKQIDNSYGGLKNWKLAE